MAHPSDKPTLQLLNARIAPLRIPALIGPDGSLEIDTLEQSPEPIDAWVPRLIVALSRRKMASSDRDRYQSAEEIQCYSGIAPVTRQSGKTHRVSRRYACPEFLRQTFP